MPFHVRMAELFLTQRRRPLTDAEVLEMTHCMAANANYCWELVALQNMSFAAYQAGDMQWLHEVCAQIDALEDGQTKRPGRKGTDRNKKSQ
ncbi:DUF7667 family protein [Paenibacillus flagellatus]